MLLDFTHKGIKNDNNLQVVTIRKVKVGCTCNCVYFCKLLVMQLICDDIFEKVILFTCVQMEFG